MLLDSIRLPESYSTPCNATQNPADRMVASYPCSLVRLTEPNTIVLPFSAHSPFRSVPVPCPYPFPYPPPTPDIGATSRASLSAPAGNSWPRFCCARVCLSLVDVDGSRGARRRRRRCCELEVRNGCAWPAGGGGGGQGLAEEMAGAGAERDGSDAVPVEVMMVGKNS